MDGTEPASKAMARPWQVTASSARTVAAAAFVIGLSAHGGEQDEGGDWHDEEEERHVACADARHLDRVARLLSTYSLERTGHGIFPPCLQ